MAARDGQRWPAVWQHLTGEFRQRLAALRSDGDSPGPRDAQIARLKTENDTLRCRLGEQATAATAQDAFRQRAVSRLAARHDELSRLREALARSATASSRTRVLTVLRTHQEETQP